MGPAFSGGEVRGVQNFRRVSARLPGIYRSGSPETATGSDVEALASLGITHVVDLRNFDEIARARTEDKSTPEGRALAELLEANDSGWMRVHLPLLDNMDTFFDAVEAQLPLGKKAEALLYKTLSGRAFNELLYKRLADGGNAVLNTAMLAGSSRNVGRALHAVAAARAKGEGVLFHCAYGKDRTGILAALLQHAAGDSSAEIVEAYALSEQILGRNTFIQDMRGGAKREGADLTTLQGSPPEGMVGTLDWLVTAHGGVDGYLASVGCDGAWRARLLQ
jgi:protein tyrosine/serine phosphatase